jgi:hypothetical protein
MAGLVPAIYVLKGRTAIKDVDGRDIGRAFARPVGAFARP